ncbi:AraC-like DNA-binding protein [Paenibacillus cellulosilyticus]|uniref:AraC-like DNA-binding protein n=1 Tax=Paenibacillus cellulosilyticus TaxID=375489 RepID=A0A2V2YMT4_9BACL|nr:AraC family transcriptional regulator [Paenibacillus cellulosilyticus]PWV95693.1 AraC-like DNA-binding protein [Paenibacillus cellulosilyticus]QKS47671.1 helix-turn-helix transcriptional regulator [Paenibacillus cellulosilyticus]
MNRELLEDTELADPAFPINVFHTTFTRVDFLRLHWHEHFELIHIEEGEAAYQIGGRTVIACQGDMLFINSGELHAASLTNVDSPATIRTLVFNPSMLGLKEPHISDIVAPYTSGLSLIANEFRPTDPLYPQLKDTFIRLVDEFNAKKPGFELSVRAYCQLLFTWLSREFTVTTRSDNEIETLRVKNDRFKELFTYLEQHYMERISVEQAAAIVHMSVYHFCRIFKQITGQTYIQFMNLYRINKAEQLLLQTSMSVTEIAAEVGCSSINSFSKLFRQLKGISPSDVRRDRTRS